MILYLDSSALVKLVNEEPGTAAARSLWDEAARVVTSRLTYPESRAALAAGLRAGRMSEAALAGARTRLDRYLSNTDQVDVGHTVAAVAGSVAERHRLRGGDAVHLATAIEMRLPGLVLATWDRSLARAAAEAGIEVAPALP